jgi:uncharacterized membrane protein
MSGRAFPWRAALFASLAFNLLVVGGLAGGYAAGLRIERHEAGDRARGKGRSSFLRALPAEERAAMRADLRRTWKETRQLRDQARAAREEVRHLASTETYDPAVVSAAFARMRTADAAVQTAWHESMTQSLSRLSAEERRAAITAFIKEWTGPMGRRGRREGRRGREERHPPPADERR